MYEFYGFDIYTLFFYVVILIISIWVEHGILQEIKDLDLPTNWRLSVYFNLFAIIGLQIGSFLGHFPFIWIIFMILFCPVYFNVLIRLSPTP